MPWRPDPTSLYEPPLPEPDVAESNPAVRIQARSTVVSAPPPVEEHVSVQDDDLLSLRSGFGFYQSYVFQLSPEQISNVREIVVDAIQAQVNKLRKTTNPEKP